ENIFALYPAHMASGRLFIPGELKIFHGGTPVLAPPSRAATQIHGFVNTNTLTKTTNTMGKADHKRSNLFLINKLRWRPNKQGV
ncbi:hypothetical protein ACVGV4_00220, partial [Enterobacter hormaechei]